MCKPGLNLHHTQVHNGIFGSSCARGYGNFSTVGEVMEKFKNARVFGKTRCEGQSFPFSPLVLRRLQKILEAPGYEAQVEVDHYNINNTYMFNRMTNGSQTILITDNKPRISFMVIYVH